MLCGGEASGHFSHPQNSSQRCLEANLPSDGGGEVGVQRCCETIVQVVRRAAFPAAEVKCLSHASGGQNANQLVEIRVISPHCLVQGSRQALQAKSGLQLWVLERYCPSHLSLDQQSL